MSPDAASEKSPGQGDLVEILIGKQVISSAQAQLARADQEVTGMTMDEVLLARGWVSQSQLEEFAPWLAKQPAKSKNTAELPSGEATYQDSLREYRRLMEKILGTGWD